MIVKNGKTYYGKQNHKCKDCGRQFVLNNKHHIAEDQLEMIRKALNGRISLLGICRVFNVSHPWLLNFAESVWKAVPINIGLSDCWLKQLRPKKAQLIVLQLDEAWSFVGCKKQKRWIWVVFDPVNHFLVKNKMMRKRESSRKAIDMIIQLPLTRSGLGFSQTASVSICCTQIGLDFPNQFYVSITPIVHCYSW